MPNSIQPTRTAIDALELERYVCNDLSRPRRAVIDQMRARDPVLSQYLCARSEERLRFFEAHPALSVGPAPAGAARRRYLRRVAGSAAILLAVGVGWCSG